MLPSLMSITERSEMASGVNVSDIDATDSKKLFRDLSEEQRTSLIAFTLQKMFGDKQKATGAMQAIHPTFHEIVKEFKVKTDAGETIDIKTYYVGALKQNMIDDMVKNLNRRVRSLIFQIDFGLVIQKVQAFCDLTKASLKEISDNEGKKFLRDLVK